MPIEFTDRRKHVSSCDDELALVKAAVWAWYQHSSRNEGKPITREFALARSPRERRPSRYKREAAAAAASVPTQPRRAFDDDDDSRLTRASSERQSPTHEEISLLDRYEVDRITSQLERLILSTRAGAGGTARPGGDATGCGGERVGRDSPRRLFSGSGMPFGCVGRKRT